MAITRKLNRVIMQVDISGKYAPQSGLSVTIKDTAGNLIASATETPAESGNYECSWTATPKYGYWYVGLVQRDEWGKLWLGEVSGWANVEGATHVSQSLCVSGASTLVGAVTAPAGITAGDVYITGTQLKFTTGSAVTIGVEQGYLPSTLNVQGADSDLGGGAGVGGHVKVRGGRGDITGNGGNVFIEGGDGTTGGIRGNVFVTASYMQVSGALRVTGSTYLSGSPHTIVGPVGLYGAMTLSGDASLTGSLRVSSDLKVTGSQRVVGDLTVTGSTTLLGGSTLSGSVLLERNPVSDYEAVPKTYVDMAVRASQLEYHLLSASSADIAGYRATTNAVGTFDEGIITATVTADDQLIEEWSTPVGDPNITGLTQGSIIAHLHAEVDDVAGVKELALYVKLYTRTAGGVETLIATSGDTAQVVATEKEFTLLMSVPDTAMALTDRIVMKVYASISGTGANPTVNLRVGADTNAMFSVPTDAGAFVRRTGDTISGAMVLSGAGARLDVTASSAYGQIRVRSTASNAEASIGFLRDGETLADSWIVGKGITTANNNLEFWNANVVHMVVSRSGVGIGRGGLAPQAGLDVAGGAIVTGSLTVSGATAITAIGPSSVLGDTNVTGSLTVSQSAGVASTAIRVTNGRLSVGGNNDAELLVDYVGVVGGRLWVSSSNVSIGKGTAGIVTTITGSLGVRQPTYNTTGLSLIVSAAAATQMFVVQGHTATAGSLFQVMGDGNIKSSGSGAGLSFQDRSVAVAHQWYGTGGMAILFKGNGDSYLKVTASTGHLVDTRITGAFQLTGSLCVSGDAMGSVGAAGAAFSLKGVSGATARTNAGFLKILSGSTAVYIPYFLAITG